MYTLLSMVNVFVLLFKTQFNFMFMYDYMFYGYALAMCLSVYLLFGGWTHPHLVVTQVC